MTIRQVAREQDTAASAVMDEIADVRGRLTDPAGQPLDATTDWLAGLAPAAACYLLPLWAREQGRSGIPLWWIWPRTSWGPGPTRRDELVLAAALALAALKHHHPAASLAPTLTVVRDRPAVPAQTRAARRPPIRGAVEQARASLVDFDGIDPATSTRPAALEALTLAAACYLLPEVMRKASPADPIPVLWAWPTAAWVSCPDRSDELLTGTALAVASIELLDAQSNRRPTVRPFAVIDGGARCS